IRTLEGPVVNILTVQFSRDGTKLLSAGFTVKKEKPVNAVIVWDLRTGKELRRFESPRLMASTAAMSPNGTQVLVGAAAADDRESMLGGALLCDVGTGKQLHVLR